jgi:hypothetical protein
VVKTRLIFRPLRPLLPPRGVVPLTVSVMTPPSGAP